MANLDEINLTEIIDKSTRAIGKVWPLYSFVTANPLSGLENYPFQEAVERAEELIGGHGYPTSAQFRQAWEDGRIDADLLLAELVENGIDLTPAESLQYLESEEPEDYKRNRGRAERKLDQLLLKWLAVFLDEGQTKWSMPDRAKGFYEAWKSLAHYDTHINSATELRDLPDTKENAIKSILNKFDEKQIPEIVTYHLTALPGWVGYIKQRNDRSGDTWAQTYPIDLLDYLAVRLILADHLDARLHPADGDQDPQRHDHSTRDAWLRAWEETYRRNLLSKLHGVTREIDGNENTNDPDAQLVFCIDTRSEIIRRHIENTGNYETHGYAGFFGIPMRYKGYRSDHTIDACPPIVTPEHRITDVPRDDETENKKRYDDWQELTTGIRSMMESLKNNVITGFNYVEGAGSFYGLTLLIRTLFPKLFYTVQNTIDETTPSYDEFTTPDLESDPDSNHDHELAKGIDFETRVNYAESAFRLMGWTDTFAPIVVFTGHASETANNPFDSSLDCGACAGNPGGPNARVLAQICNQSEVREELRERGISIPVDTYFIAGEHNTTTDEIELYTKHVPRKYRENIENLETDLERAQTNSTAERMRTLDGDNSNSTISATRQRSADWAQTRPEWGLAGNASFFIGPPSVTENLDLDGRAFLHSYDWRKDPEGEALENIFAGPLVVTQWINNQYYFATVSNGVYGSGSKVTQNPVGNFGVQQGNGSDLMSGLPLQSLKETDSKIYHQPIRLTAIVHAPRNIVKEKLEKLATPLTLINNEWISLCVLDPNENNRAYQLVDEEWNAFQFDRISEETPQGAVRN